MSILKYRRFKLYINIFFLIYAISSIYKSAEPESVLENDKEPISELYQIVNSSYMTKVISDFSSLLDSYAFSDIIKNPPKPYENIKLNISDELNKIKTDGERPFYEFYRDIKKLLSYFRDSILDIKGLKFPISNFDIKINFEDYYFCLPFLLYLDYEKKNEVNMYIKEYYNCSKFYAEEIKQKIRKYFKIPLEKINGIDAFDYIQNFGNDFYKLKNPDSYFTFILNNIHNNNLMSFPLLPKEINEINLTFKNNETLNTHFHINKEKNIIKKRENNLQKNISSIYKVKKILKNIKNDNGKKNISNNNDIISWDYESEDGGVKCKEDYIKDINVFLIKSFDTDINVIAQCVYTFYSNNRRIVIISSQNIEGENDAIYIFTQLLFPKLVVKFNFAMKQTELNKNYFQSFPNLFFEPKECIPFKNWDSFIESKPDDYGDGIKHYRTKVYSPISKTLVEELKNIREILLEEFIDKKSTDILILTDTVSYGKPSNFLKYVQNNGAAITASYAGNPRLNKDKIETLDASLDSCDLNIYKSDQFDSNLEEKEFILYDLPFAETFENMEGVKIPNSFNVNRVDEITDIYHSYDDIYYDEFIEISKKIFDKYNNNNECNKDNVNLVYESDKCIFSDDNNAHGGYRCNNNGYWETNCKKSYCNIGYYFDKIKKRCIIDECTSAEYIYIDEEEEKNYTILPNMTYVFKLNTDRFAYFFISSVDDIINYENMDNCTKFCALQNDFELMYVNFFHNLKEITQIKIISKIININIDSYKLTSPKFSQIEYMDENIIDIYQITEDNYMYVESYDKSVKFYYAIYDENFTVNDLLNLNPNYFKESLDQFLFLRKNTLYIFYYKVEIGFCKIYFYNKLSENIDISSGDENIFYLESNKKYKLNFNENILPFIIRLNPKINSSLKILDKSGEIKNITLSNKYFYPISQPYNGVIEVSTYNSNAIIEILYSFGNNNTDIITNEVNDYIISKEVSLIEYSPQDDKKIMQIYIKSNNGFSFGGYGGFSKDNYFHYSNFYYPNNYFNVLNFSINLYNPLKDVEIEENEKYYVSLIFTKTQKEQSIFINVKYIRNPIEELYENIDEFYINNVISNLTKIIGNYIYLDIIKNPPNLDFSLSPINLIDSLNKIKKVNRNFYDFYREIREILATPKDINLNILSDNTPKSIKFTYITACLPFSFYVDKIGNSETKIYIKYYPDCAIYFSEKIREYVKEKDEKKISLEKINGDNPFTFIQNFGIKYRSYKSVHSQFSYMKNHIHSFSLNIYPFKPEELKMNFKFEDDESTLNIDYFIFIPNIENMNELLCSQYLDEKDFEEFYKNEIQKHPREFNDFFESIKKYKKLKGISQKEIKSENYEIQWDYETSEENGIKCKVDTLNKLNVLIQGSFNLEYNKAFDIIYKCTRKFYQNSYKILVIENSNVGGDEKLALILCQLLQVKITNKAYLAYSLLDTLEKDFNDSPEKFVDVETCRPFDNFKDFLNGTIIDYSTENQTIIHKKSKIVDILDKDTRRKLEEIRKEFINFGKLKNPTDIIIFTDSLATGAASIFIKSFQNEGGAIIAGFNGNPNIEKNLFDSSQSPSIYMNFSNIQEYSMLKFLGFTINSITVGETYEDDYKIKKPITREYKLNPIDERTDIYEPYTDNKYNIFINEAKKIFRKYNEDGYCNPFNDRLVFEKDEKCYNYKEDKFAHGGYDCGKNGSWSYSCKKYYCELGYYYNYHEDKCMIDYCTNDPGEKYIVLNDVYEDLIIINKKNNTEYIFEIESEVYIYFFKSNKPGYIHYQINIPCPSLCILQKNLPNHKNRVYINIFRNATDEDIIIHINSFKNFVGLAQSIIFQDNHIVEDLIELQQRFILISEVFEDYIFYFKTFNYSYNAYYTEYNDKMEISDILNINQNYYKDCSNKIIEAKKGKIYIFASISDSENRLLQMFIQPKIINNRINISSTILPLNLYLSNEKSEYILNFANNKYDRMIHLLNSVKDNEIIITNSKTGKKVIINSNNSYYTFDGINQFFTNEITIKIIKGNYTLIEFLFALDKSQFEIINEKEIDNHRILKSPIIKFDENNKNKNIIISLFSQNKKKFEYSYITGNSKNDYVNFPLEILPEISGKYSYELTIFNDNKYLEKNESFYLILYINNNFISDDSYKISISKKEESSKEKDNQSQFYNFKSWIITLIPFVYLFL